MTAWRVILVERPSGRRVTRTVRASTEALAAAQAHREHRHGDCYVESVTRVPARTYPLPSGNDG